MHPRLPNLRPLIPTHCLEEERRESERDGIYQRETELKKETVNIRRDCVTLSLLNCKKFILISSSVGKVRPWGSSDELSVMGVN